METRETRGGKLTPETASRPARKGPHVVAQRSGLWRLDSTRDQRVSTGADGGLSQPSVRVEAHGLREQGLVGVHMPDVHGERRLWIEDVVAVGQGLVGADAGEALHGAEGEAEGCWWARWSVAISRSCRFNGTSYTHQYTPSGTRASPARAGRADRRCRLGWRP